MDDNAQPPVRRERDGRDGGFGGRSSGPGVCYAFQRGECERGSGCRFSHDCKYLLRRHFILD
jgi:hypothetical protein